MTETIEDAKSIEAVTIKKRFSRETSVSTEIKADPSIIWTLLTRGSDFPRWNNTVISIDGRIEPGGKIKLKSALDPKRTFKLNVKEFVVGERLVWGGSSGNRIYTLTNGGSGSVTFLMSERIGSFMFPLYAKYIPPFDKSFEQFAANLKKEAESIQNMRN